MNSFIALDREVFLALNGDCGPVMDSIMWALSSKWAFVVIAIPILYMIYRSRTPKEFLLFILLLAAMIAVADQGAGFFKHFTPKLRPTHTSELDGLVHTVNGYVGGLYGTVSAHAANSFAVATFTSFLLRKRWYTIAIFLFSAAVAYSRIYLGAHYPADIMFGTIMGLSVGSIFYYLYIVLSNTKYFKTKC